MGKRYPERETIRPLKKMINSATGRSECAAGGVEETENGTPEVECHPCEEGFDEKEAGNKNTIRVATPYKPTQAEVDDHYLTHLPYRSWCRHCI